MDLFSCIGIGLVIGLIGGICIFVWQVRNGMISRPPKTILEFEEFLKDCGIKDNDLSMLLINAARSLCGWNMRERTIAYKK